MGHFQVYKIDDFEDSVARSHLYRYYSARGYVEPGEIVLDAACGCGAGTEALSKVAGKVIGMDRDKDAIEFAQINHKKDNNYFVVGNLDQLEKFPEVDVTVSLETLEHLRYPESFASKVMNSTKKRIIISTPIIPTKHEDSTHLQDFNEQQVIDMFTNEEWGCIDSAKQGPYLLISFYRKI